MGARVIAAPGRTVPDRGAGSVVAARFGARRWRVVLSGNWLWAALVMLALGLWRIGRPEVWRDELASWSAARRSPGQLWAMVHHVDASSGCYYLFLHYWMGVFGDAPAVLRLPSALAMAGAAACTARCASAWFGRAAGLWAGLVFALLPIVSRYAQEAREYAIGILAAALAGWLLVRALRRPAAGWRTWGAWAAYGGAVVVLEATNMVAGCLLLGHLAGVLLWSARRPAPGVTPLPVQRPARLLARLLARLPVRLPDWPSPPPRARRVCPYAWRCAWRCAWRWGVVAGAATVVVAPVMWLAVREAGRQIGGIPAPHLAAVYALPARLVGSSLLSGVVLLAAALALGRRRRRAVLVVAAGVVLPLVVIFVVSRGRTSFWYPRYLLFLLPGLAVLAGAALARIRLAGALAGLALVGLLGLPDQHSVRTPGAHDVPEYPAPAPNVPVLYTPVTALVGREQQPGDGRLYLATDGWMAYDLAFDYHLGRRQPVAVCRKETGLRHDDLWPVPDDDYDRCLGGATRLWIVRPGDLRGDVLSRAGLPAATLRQLRADLASRYRLVSVRYRDGTTIVLYTRRAQAPTGG
jgi:mannosyltransferase